jgi:hypothetical protein
MRRESKYFLRAGKARQFLTGTVFTASSQTIVMEQRRNNPAGNESRHQNPLPQEIGPDERKATEEAHRTADHDMEEDAEFTATSPNDDLDEGESARLGEKTDLI